ncbi:LacI family DNA-binding transcriptional regulator [Paenibacillus alkalitolerans]|uniref:LacI family DNA-binding transcriptional regulator n=1 Tax=Paenibacillus alkalitolerans TaxID=2799335 RepID=UPI0018F5F21B|nr:LacI family DNA-binding transcriptional regulator [Paenibacillus alkalitolerans]
MTKKVTMQQIADHLGVSKFAVSKALSGKAGVSVKTRERIFKAAKQLGYFSRKHDRFKQAPAISKASSTGVVVVLFPDVRFQTQESSYWAPIVEGITHELTNNGLDMVAITELVGDNAINVINPASIDGTISVGPVSNALLSELGRWGLPLITIDNETSSDAETDCLFTDNFNSVRRLTDQLIGAGHRSLQFVGDVRYARSFYDRWLGFRSSLEEHGIPYSPEQGLIRLSESSFHNFEELVGIISGLVQRDALPGAFVCACDKIAMMTIEALRSLGLSVPSDCSVTGFDNIEECAKFTPMLTTIDVPKQWLGIRAVQMLLWRTRFREAPPEKIYVPAEIVNRESTSIPKIRKIADMSINVENC